MKRMINLPTSVGKDRVKKPSSIVIHAMAEYLTHEGKTYHAVDFLKLAGLSCHFMVTPGGDVIQCADPSKKTTWHARGHNTSSIGVEILVPGLLGYSEFKDRIDQPNWCNDIQYQGAVELCQQLRVDYTISLGQVLSHSRLDPNRKSDPGRGFPWNQFLHDVEFPIGKGVY